MKNRVQTPEIVKTKGKTIIANRRKFPVRFSYSKNGQKPIMMSNNAKFVEFMSDNYNSLGDQIEYAYLNNIIALNDNSFRNSVHLTAIDMNPELESIGSDCFNGCQCLLSVEIPNNVKTLGKNSFSNCQKMQIVDFEHYEYDSEENSTPYLQSVGDYLLSNSMNVQNIVFPESITTVKQLETEALKNSNVKQITFLGMNSSESKKLAESKCLGLEKDCIIHTKDNKQLKYLASTKTIEDETYSQFGTAKIATNGKVNKLLLGRKIYSFTEELYNWCCDPTQHDTKKFPSPHACPLIVIFVDFKTSYASTLFLKNVLENSNLYSWMKENLKCYVFLLDRNGYISNGANSDLNFFRSLPYFSNHEDKDFVHISFIYDGNFNQTTFYPGSLDEFKDVITTFAEMTKFGDFDYSDYESILDEPDPETIPTNGGDGTLIKNFHKSLPEWCSGNSIASSTAWNIASNPMDFDLVSTPETTYILAGAYDEQQPNDPDRDAPDGFVRCTKLFSDNIEVMYGRDCYERYGDKFLEGVKYRYFMFYETSHGSTRYISICKNFNYTEIWKAFSNMSSHQRVYGIFDSCHSGSMLKSKSTLNSENNIDNDIISYLEYKFARRDELLIALFGSAEAARSVKPKMILQSPTSAENYSYYWPGKTTCFMKPYEKTYLDNKNVRFNKFWELIHKNCYKPDERGDAEPHQMVYPNESNSYYKNKIYF